MEKRGLQINPVKQTFRILFGFFKNIPASFRKIDYIKGILEPFIVVVIAGFIGILLNLIFKLIVNFSLVPALFRNMDWFQFFLPLIFGVIAILIGSLLVHLLIKIFRGKANLAATYKIIAYSMVPTLLFYALPFFDKWIIWLSMFLVIYGIKELHKMPAFRAFLIVLIANFIYWLVQISLGFLFIRIFMQGGAV